jgi:hypothetical protein
MCSPAELHTGRLCESLIHTFSLLGRGEVSGAVDERDRYRLAFIEVRRVVSEWMTSYAQSKGKRLWCEKTPRNLKYLDVLKDVFPDAKYLCLHRHCMDVVHSCLEGSIRGFFVDISYYARNISDPYARGAGNHISTFIDSWMDKTDKMLKFEQANATSCLRIKYEDIVEHPGETLKPVFEFLGVEWDKSLLDQVFSTQHDNGPGDKKILFSKKIHGDSIGQGSSISLGLIPPDMLEKMNTLLARLGYPIVAPGWEMRPSAPGLPSEQQGKQEAVSDEAGQANESVIKDIFASHFPQQLSRQVDRLPQMRGKYKFVVTGSGGGTWTINLREGQGRITTDNGEADCTITVSSNDLIQMVKGNLNAANASIQGRLRVAGDSKLALMIGPVLLGI